MGRVGKNRWGLAGERADRESSALTRCQLSPNIQDAVEFMPFVFCDGYRHRLVG